MYLDELREYCLSKPGTEETLPFGPDTLVFKVAGKMFALSSIDRGESVNLKCDPERGLALREEYPEDVLPGYHMNKKHWNTVKLKGRLTHEQLFELVDHSYRLIVQSLPKKVQAELGFE